MIRPGGLRAGVLLALTTALASPVGAVELAESLRAAVESSPAMAQARASLRAAEERRAQAELALVPQVGMTLQAGGRYSSDGFGGPTGGGSNGALSSTLAIEAGQTLYDSGRNREDVALSADEVEAAGHRLAAAEQQVLLGAAEAHVGVLRFKELLGLARGNRDLLREQLSAARSRLRLGIGTRTEVAQAETRLAAAESNVVRRDGELETAYSRYRLAVGRRPATDPLAPERLPALPASESLAVEQAIRDHPQLAEALALERASRSRLRRARLGADLTFSAFGSASLLVDDARPSDDRSRQDASIGLRLTKPLFGELLVSSLVREASEGVAASRAVVASTHRGTENGLRAAWENLAVAKSLIRAGETRVAAAELAFVGVREKYETGLGTVLEVLDAEQEVLDARTALVGSRYDEYLAAYRLRAALGSLRLEALDP